ncbi:hypothetical protein DFR67_11891 [Williamsia limnetica]|uniref:Uncharacterized protein n=1 Tax=Williamsia limnetica TaxID=882452 RepID=A0A318RFR8_WILLI|nr:hypothetical protein DFR67_11891 [Williamsia limnetica]
MTYEEGTLGGCFGTVDGQIGTVGGCFGTVDIQIGTLGGCFGTVDGQIGTVGRCFGTVDGGLPGTVTTLGHSGQTSQGRPSRSDERPGPLAATVASETAAIGPLPEPHYRRHAPCRPQ